MESPNFDFRGIFWFMLIVAMIVGYFVVKGIVYLFNHIHWS